MKMTRRRSRRRHPPHRRHAHGRRGAGVRGAARRRSQRVRAVAVRRRRRGACRRGRRGARHAPHRRAGAAGRILGARAALHRRAARLHPLRASARSTGSIRRMPSNSSATSRPRRRASLPKEGLDPSAASFERELDLRYAGQGYELRVPLERPVAERARRPSAQGGARALRRACTPKFTAMRPRKRAVEVVSYRLRVRVAVPKYQPQALPAGAAVIASAGFDQGHAARIVRCRQGDSTRRFMIVTSLPSASTLPAPPSSSSSTPRRSCRPAGTAFVDRHGNLILERKD